MLVLTFCITEYIIAQNKEKTRRLSWVGLFDVCALAHVALRLFIMPVMASQSHFPANTNAELAVPPLFWPVNCIKIEEHVELLSYCSFSIL